MTTRIKKMITADDDKDDEAENDNDNNRGYDNDEK